MTVTGAVPNSATDGPPLAAGSYSFQAVYSGDSNYSGSTSSCEPFKVNKGSSHTATVVDDASTGAPWAGTETTGSSAFDTATVTTSDTVTATGTVSYTFFENGACSGTGTPAGTVILTLTGAVPDSATEGPPLAAGSYSFEALYSGDSNYSGSTSSCEPFSVAVGPTTVSTTLHYASTGTVIPVGSFVPQNTSVYDTSTINGQVSGFTASGTVVYSFFLNGSCTVPPAWTQTVTVNSNGTVPQSNATGPLPSGMYAFQATYSGDSNYSGNTSPCEPFVIGQPALTPGYWKNHLSVTMAIINANQPFYIGDDLITTAAQVTGIFSAMNCSNNQPNNAIGCLAGQLLAAILNVDNGAPASIAPTVGAAQLFLGHGGTVQTVTYGGYTAKGVLYTGPGTYKLSGLQRSVALALENDLSNYNASGI